MRIASDPTYQLSDFGKELLFNGLYARLLNPIQNKAGWWVWALAWVIVKIVDVMIWHPFIMIGAFARTIRGIGDLFSNLLMLFIELIIFSISAQSGLYSEIVKVWTREPAIYVIDLILHLFAR